MCSLIVFARNPLRLSFLRKFNNRLKTIGIKQEYLENETSEENEDIESFHNPIKTDYIESMKSIISMMVK